MNITTDIESKFKVEDKAVSDLAHVIDEPAFQAENFFDDNKTPLTSYWNDRRRKALLLADKLLKAGYGKLTHSPEGIVL